MLRPRADRLLIAPIERIASSTIAVVLREKFNTGMVIAAGEGKRDKKGRLQPLDVKVGDTVRYGGEEYFQFPEYFDEQTLTKYHVIQEADVCGVVEN